MIHIKINWIKKRKDKKGFFLLIYGKCVSDTSCPCQKYCRKYQKLAFYSNHTLRFVQIFEHNHTNDFYQEVKYLKIFEYQINRYERTKECLNANHNVIQAYSNVDINDLKLSIHF